MNHRPFSLARQVCYLSGEQNYTWTHLLSGYRDLRRGPLALVAQYYPSFLRIHKQYVINPEYLLQIHQQTRSQKRPLLEVELVGGVRLPIAQSRVYTLLPVLQSMLQRNQCQTSGRSCRLAKKANQILI